MERYLYAYETVEVPFERLAEVLERHPERILTDATDAAVAHAHTAITELDVEVGEFTIGREVEVEFGASEREGDWLLVIPLRWRAAEHAALFPAMQGQLEVEALSFQPPLTQLTFVGHYRPPGGLLGGLADAAVGHRVARRVIGRFLARVAERCRELVSTPQDAGR